MTIFDAVKTQVTVEQVIQDYTKLKRAGIYLKGSCPFHQEATASFTVSPHKGIFYCFGCHAGGDVISFIAKTENCSQLDAAKFLIERYSLTVPEGLLTASSPKEQEERDMYLRVCDALAHWAHEQLENNQQASAYLAKRGVDTKNRSIFMIGYFPGGLQAVNALMKTMRTHAIMAKDLVEAHILIEGKNVFYSPFEERILFPIRDHMGRCCGFGGRTFKEHDDRPKYYNSKESPHFAKGSLIFGFDAAKKAIQEKGTAFLVEGYMDCIAMAQHGYTNTVATLGTACTAEHLKQMGRHAHTINVLYDGDNAGRKAIVRLAELCWQTNLELKVITLPDQEDPASFLLKNGSLDPLIQEAKDIFFFLLEAMGNGFSHKPLGEKLSTIRKFISLILSIDDHLKRDLLLNQAARTFDVPFDTLKQELGNVKRPHEQEEASNQEKTSQTPTDGYALEKKILAAILTNTALLTEETELYLKTYLPTPFMHVFTKLTQAKLAQAQLSQANHGLTELCTAKNPLEPVDFVQFFATLTEEEKNMVSSIMLKDEAESSEETFKTLMRQMHKKHWRFFTLTIKKRLAQARSENNATESVRLVEEFAAVKKSMIDSQSDYGGSQP